jgi:Bacterial transcriptional activator domain
LITFAITGLLSAAQSVGHSVVADSLEKPWLIRASESSPRGGQGGGSPGRVGDGTRRPGRAWGAAQITLFTARRGFLPGDDLPWIADVRRELEALYLRALEAYAGASLRVGGTELATAERSARELVARAPFSESGYRVLMEALAQRGNVALSDELGIPPSPATRDLHARLLRPGAG